MCSTKGQVQKWQHSQSAVQEITPARAHQLVRAWAVEIHFDLERHECPVAGNEKPCRSNPACKSHMCDHTAWGGFLSEDLASLAPDIEEFMKAYLLDMEDVNSIMPLGFAA